MIMWAYYNSFDIVIYMQNIYNTFNTFNKFRKICFILAYYNSKTPSYLCAKNIASIKLRVTVAILRKMTVIIKNITKFTYLNFF